MFERIERRWTRFLDEHRARFQDLKIMGIMFKRSSLSVMGATIVTILIIVAAIGPFIIPFDPLNQVLETRLDPPSPRLVPIVLTLLFAVLCSIVNAYIVSKHDYNLPKEGLSRKIVITLILLTVFFVGITLLQVQIGMSHGEHILGVDHMGRDMLTRIVYGARISIRIAIIVAVIVTTVGMIVGLTSGYFGGKIDDLVMRISDIFLVFPGLVLAMAVTAALGRGINNVVIAMAIVIWPRFARLARGEALIQKHKPYIEASRALGANSWRIIFFHLVPLTISPTMVMMTLEMGYILLIVAGLGFIGFGAQPPSPEWGLMVSDGRTRLVQAWWISTFPGLAILLVVLGFNLLGDGLRDILDPKLRR